MDFNQSLSVLAQVYKRLVKDNTRFVESSCRPENLRTVIDQRELVFEDIEVMSAEMANHIIKTYPGYELKNKSLPEVIKAVKTLMPELCPQADAVVKAIEELIESDKSVEKKVLTVRDAVKAELTRIRKGKIGLKGYQQANPVGSCFINKVK